ncbi:MAG: hypothetical protein HFJ23_04515 [Clostridia bacterium]|nr:hypothetical protein [Clostridia bacterium]
MVNLIFIILFVIFGVNSELIYVNILIFLFNMITIYPLDGGRILKYILCFFVGRFKALRITNILSNLTAIILTIFIFVLSIYFKNIAYVFMNIYILIILIVENKKYRIKKEMYKILENYIAINKD